jgi:hypothetical protein
LIADVRLTPVSSLQVIMFSDATSLPVKAATVVS